MQTDNATQDLAAEWYEQETNSEISVPEFEQLCEAVFNQNAKCKEISAKLDSEKEVLNKMKAKLMALMEQFGKSKYSSNSGTLFTKDEFSVKVPKDPESREQFFGWLKEKGIFDSVITVNSQTLKSLYNSMLEESGDPDFKIAGLNDISSSKTLSIRSK